jgi:multidrug efflux pump subunit AcrA (membrane-fusion protein)
MMSNDGFKVEANIAEADIAKVQPGQKANITLDAYGSDVVFEAVVVRIDPGETIIEGVPTYKTVFKFTTADNRVKSGMTANIDIIGQSKENVVAVPLRAVSNKNGGKFVTIQKDPKTTEEVKVKTGIRGADGLVEITEGLNEGDTVVVGEVKK